MPQNNTIAWLEKLFARKPEWTTRELYAEADHVGVHKISLHRALDQMGLRKEKRDNGFYYIKWENN